MKKRRRSEEVEQIVLRAPQLDTTEQLIYEKLSLRVRAPHNRALLRQIASDEHRHDRFWKKYTGRDASRHSFRVWKYILLARIFRNHCLAKTPNYGTTSIY